MIREQKIQFNNRFEKLAEECLNEVRMAVKEGKTLKEKIAIWNNYGYDSDDFDYYMVRMIDALAVELGLSSHLQRSADFLNKSPRHIQNHRR